MTSFGSVTLPDSTRPAALYRQALVTGNLGRPGPVSAAFADPFFAMDPTSTIHLPLLLPFQFSLLGTEHAMHMRVGIGGVDMVSKDLAVIW